MSKIDKELIVCQRESLENTVIPEGIVSIGPAAFSGISIQNIDISKLFPKSLRHIGDEAFAYSEIELSKDLSSTIVHFENIETIGKEAFKQVSIIEGFPKEAHNLTFRFSKIESIGESAFEDIHHTIVVNNHSNPVQKLIIHFVFGADCPINKIEQFTFYKSAGDIYIASDQIRYVDYAAFALAQSLDFKNADKVEFWDNYSLAYLTIKTPFKLNEKITAIPSGFDFLTDIPSTITTIWSNAYEKVTDFRLPPTLTYIAPDAFEKGSTFIVDAGSYAEQWCKQEVFSFSYSEASYNLDWLNN